MVAQSLIKETEGREKTGCRDVNPIVFVFHLLFYFFFLAHPIPALFSLFPFFTFRIPSSLTFPHHHLSRNKTDAVPENDNHHSQANHINRRSRSRRPHT